MSQNYPPEFTPDDDVRRQVEARFGSAEAALREVGLPLYPAEFTPDPIEPPGEKARREVELSKKAERLAPKRRLAKKIERQRRQKQIARMQYKTSPSGIAATLLWPVMRMAPLDLEERVPIMGDFLRQYEAATGLDERDDLEFQKSLFGLPADILTYHAAFKGLAKLSPIAQKALKHFPKAVQASGKITALAQKTPLGQLAAKHPVFGKVLAGAIKQTAESLAVGLTGTTIRYAGKEDIPPEVLAEYYIRDTIYWGGIGAFIGGMAGYIDAAEGLGWTAKGLQSYQKRHGGRLPRGFLKKVARDRAAFKKVAALRKKTDHKRVLKARETLRKTGKYPEGFREKYAGAPKLVDTSGGLRVVQGVGVPKGMELAVRPVGARPLAEVMGKLGVAAKRRVAALRDLKPKFQPANRLTPLLTEPYKSQKVFIEIPGDVIRYQEGIVVRVAAPGGMSKVALPQGKSVDTAALFVKGSFEKDLRAKVPAAAPAKAPAVPARPAKIGEEVKPSVEEVKARLAREAKPPVRKEMAAPPVKAKVPAPAVEAKPPTGKMFVADANMFISTDFIPTEIEGAGKLYHVSINAPAVQQEGFQVGRGLGLGLGEVDTFSVTYNPVKAEEIASTIRLAADVAQGRVKASDVLKAMEERYHVDTLPEDRAVWEQFTNTVGEDVPPEADLDEWVDKNIVGPENTYSFLRQLDVNYSRLFDEMSGVEVPMPVGLGAPFEQMLKVDPEKVGIIEVLANKDALVEHVASEDELVFKPEDLQVAPAEVAALVPEKVVRKVKRIIKKAKRVVTKEGLLKEKLEEVSGKIGLKKMLTPERIKEIEASREFFEKHPEYEVPESVLAGVERLGEIDPAKLAPEKAEEIVESVQRLLKQYRQKDELLASLEARKVSKTVDDVIVTMGGDPAKKGGGPTKIGEPERHRGWISQAVGPVINDLPHQLMFTGGKEQGPLVTAVWEPIWEGQTQNVVLTDGAFGSIAADMTKAGMPPVSMKGWGEATPRKAEKQSIKLSNGRTIQLSKEQQMTVYLVSQSEGGRRHLLSKHGAFPAEGKKHTRTGQLTKADIQTIIDGTSKEVKAVADAYAKWVREQGAKLINETSMKLEGVELAKEKFYWPLNVSKDFIPKGARARVKAAYRVWALEDLGILKARVKSDAPLDIPSATTTLGRVINQTITYHAMAPAYRDASVLLAQPKLRLAMKSLASVQELEAIETHLRLLEDTSYNPGVIEKWVAKRIPNILSSIIIGRPTIMVLQATSAGWYASEFSPATVASYARLLTPGEKREALGLIDRLSPIYSQRLRAGKIERDVPGASGVWYKLTGKKSLRQKMAVGVVKGDQAAICRGMLMAKRDLKLGKKPLVPPDGWEGMSDDEQLKWWFEHASNNTQPGWAPGRRSLAAAARHPLPRLATVFRGAKDIFVMSRKTDLFRYRQGTINRRQLIQRLVGETGYYLATKVALKWFFRALYGAAVGLRLLRPEKMERQFKAEVWTPLAVLADAHFLTAPIYRMVRFKGGRVTQSIIGDTLSRAASAVTESVKGVKMLAKGEKDADRHLFNAIEDAISVVGRYYGIPLEVAVGAERTTRMAIMEERKAGGAVLPLPSEVQEELEDHGIRFKRAVEEVKRKKQIGKEPVAAGRRRRMGEK